MPLFEYRCASCGHIEEVLQKYNDPAPDACSQCGTAKSMSREVSMTSFQLKGGGWYKDLYSSTSKSDSKPSGGESKGSSDKAA